MLSQLAEAVISSLVAMTSPTPGRRERNKREKLERITSAASELFAEFGVGEVTTQQIADKADVAGGTLFLYAKNKAELLLLVQNSSYVDALARGRAAAEKLTDPLEALMALLGEIVACNRKHVENGRVYLRELVFGDPTEPRHAEALELIADTETAIADVLDRPPGADRVESVARARIILAVMFLSLAGPGNVTKSEGELVDEIRSQIALVLASAAPE